MVCVREFRNPHGWMRFTQRNSSQDVHTMRRQRRMRRTCVVSIVASVYALTVYPRIDITDSFRFAAMCITMLFGLKIFRDSSTALTFK